MLQNRGIPCPPDVSSRDARYRCAWMTAHRAATNTSSASFLVSVGGKFRPVVRCHHPRSAESRGGDRRRRRVARLFAGEPEVLPGIDLKTWNASIAASRSGEDLVVRVVGQMYADGETDAFFPDLFVTLFRPPNEGEYGSRIVAYERVSFSPDVEGGARVEFDGVAAGGLSGYMVDVRPAGSWVCQGANDGCQKRYAMVEDLLDLTERARAQRGVGVQA